MKLSAEQKEFVSRFFPLFILLYAIIATANLQNYTSALAASQAGTLTAFGIASTSNGSTVTANGSAFEIVAECGGLVMFAMLAALLYATPRVARKKRAVSLAVFAPALLLFNYVRLLGTLGAGAVWGGSALEIVHFSLWVIDASVVLICWSVGVGVSLTGRN